LNIPTKKPGKSGARPDPFKDEKDKDSKSYFFMFRGLKVKKYRQRFTLLSKKYSFMKKIHAMDFVLKFAADIPKFVTEKYFERKADIPINVPRVY
jgi:hypothetical protein